jgi:formate dehydrogenase subunit gamma
MAPRYALLESQDGRMALTALLERFRFIVGAWIVLMAVVMAAPAAAVQLGPDGAPDPQASVVNQQTLLREAPRIKGRIDIPDTKASVLIQPVGRRWEAFHEVGLRWIGAIAILGMIVALGAAYLIMGRIRISAGRSGQKVRRFNAFERFSHWLTAASFVILGLTGLNITFGKILLLPMIGPGAFSGLSAVAKYTHNFVSFAFAIGLVMIVVLWIKDNLPNKVDIDWIKQGGGFIKSKHAPAGRFNAGEKMVFWFAFGAGVAVAVSGFMLLFPFYVTNIAGMQTAEVVHAVIAVLFVAVILAHIYIGTLGMEGAFEAMGTGEVDLNWAREHHDVWLRDQLAKEQPPRRPGQPSATPAE